MLSSARFSIAARAFNSLIEYVQSPSCCKNEWFNDDKNDLMMIIYLDFSNSAAGVREKCDFLFNKFVQKIYPIVYRINHFLPEAGKSIS